MSALGTEFKINVHMDPIDGYHMSDVDFHADFYVNARNSLRLKKTDMTMVDEDNYLAVVDSRKTGRGQLKFVLYAAIPDGDCENGIRNEISDETICEGCYVT